MTSSSLIDCTVSKNRTGGTVEAGSGIHIIGTDIVRLNRCTIVGLPDIGAAEFQNAGQVGLLASQSCIQAGHNTQYTIPDFEFSEGGDKLVITLSADGSTEGTVTLVVTTLNDELDSPAGDDLSLREALRDSINDTTIVFDASLNGGVIDLDPDLGELLVEKPISIDASTLPAGITINGRSNGNIQFDSSTETRCFIIDNRPTERKVTVALNNLTI